MLPSSSPCNLPIDLIRQHLAKLSASSQFAQSRRMQAFLEILVTGALRGEADQLKETVIASEVYGRGADFDPKVDSIVRSEASRLRKKLEEYYAAAGGDPIRFHHPKGANVLTIEVADQTPAVAKRPFPARIALLAAVGATVAAAGFYLAARKPAPAEVFQVTSLPGRQIQPSISPDGSRVAFAWATVPPVRRKRSL